MKSLLYQRIEKEFDMNKLFLIGTLIGIGFGIFKFMKKNNKPEMPKEEPIQA